jgi:hypothetical protein
MFAAGIASSLAAPFGAWLSYALPPVIRRRAFSALLLIAVANIMVKRGSLIASSVEHTYTVSAPGFVDDAPPVRYQRGRRAKIA